MVAPVTSAEASRVLTLLEGYWHVALAVSGGPDSLALLHLVANRQGEGPSVTVLTVDHGLRASSSAEAALVGRVAASLGLPHAVLEWRHEANVVRGLQAAARRARYDLMAAYCHAHGIEAIVTAHQLDDQAETFLMRLQRGSGLDGLAAIPERGDWAGIAVLRPLLTIPKARLEATLSQAALEFAIDPSNQDARFERARLRASRDALAELGLTADAMARSASRLRRARLALDADTSAFFAAYGTMSEAGFARIDREQLAMAPEEIALRALARSIEAVGGRAEPVSLAKLESLLAALKAEPGKIRTLGGCRIAPRGESLVVCRETRRSGLPELHLGAGERSLWDNRFCVELAPTEREPLVIRALGEAGWRDIGPSSPWRNSLPRYAGVSLPACWHGDRLVALPSLAGGVAEPDARLRARFVGAGAFGLRKRPSV